MPTWNFVGGPQQVSHGQHARLRNSLETCRHCGGHGEIIGWLWQALHDTAPMLTGLARRYVPCRKCHGAGEVLNASGSRYERKLQRKLGTWGGKQTVANSRDREPMW
jgi:DnaJ-class molecular chaperone